MKWSSVNESSDKYVHPISTPEDGIYISHGLWITCHAGGIFGTVVPRTGNASMRRGRTSSRAMCQWEAKGALAGGVSPDRVLAVKRHGAVISGATCRSFAVITRTGQGGKNRKGWLLFRPAPTPYRRSHYLLLRELTTKAHHKEEENQAPHRRRGLALDHFGPDGLLVRYIEHQIDRRGPERSPRNYTCLIDTGLGPVANTVRENLL